MNEVVSKTYIRSKEVSSVSAPDSEGFVQVTYVADEGCPAACESFKEEAYKALSTDKPVDEQVFRDRAAAAFLNHVILTNLKGWNLKLYEVNAIGNQLENTVSTCCEAVLAHALSASYSGNATYENLAAALAVAKPVRQLK